MTDKDKKVNLDEIEEFRAYKAKMDTKITELTNKLAAVKSVDIEDDVDKDESVASITKVVRRLENEVANLHLEQVRERVAKEYGVDTKLLMEFKSPMEMENFALKEKMKATSPETPKVEDKLVTKHTPSGGGTDGLSAVEKIALGLKKGSPLLVS